MGEGGGDVFLGGLVGEGEQPGLVGSGGKDLGPHLGQALLRDLPHVDGLALVVAVVHERGELVEDLHEPSHVAADHRGELVPEGGVVVALADQLHEGVDRHQRVLDLVGDARHHLGEELELLGGALLLRELPLGGEVLEHQHRAHRLRPVAHHRVGRDLQRQIAVGELHLGAVDRAALGERGVQHVAQRGRQHSQVAVQHLARGESEDLGGPAVDPHDLLFRVDGDHAVRHAGEDALVELLLVLEQLVDADLAYRGGEVRAEREECLGLAAAVAASADALAQGEDADQLAVRADRDGQHRLEGGQLPRDLARDGIRGAAARLLDLDEATLGGQPQGKPAVVRESQRLDHLRGQAAIRGHPVEMAARFSEQDRGAARTHELRHPVEELVEHAGQVEAGGQGLGEFLGHLRGRVWRRRRAVHGGVRRHLTERVAGGPESGHLLEQPQLVVGLLEQALELAGGEGL